MKKIIYWSFLTIVAAVLLWWGASLLQNRNLLSKYGVSYENSFGEHPSFQEIQFHLDRDKKHILGPKIIGDELYVKFQSNHNGEIPEIVVCSRVYRTHFVVLKLNFTDSSKPEFDVVENKMMTISYPPLGYYWP